MIVSRLTSYDNIGKTLEQMAQIFGDEVDAQGVLDSAAAHEKLEHADEKLSEDKEL